MTRTWQGAYPLPDLEDYNELREKLRAELTPQYPTTQDQLTIEQKNHLVGWFLGTRQPASKWNDFVESYLRRRKWELEDRILKIAPCGWAKVRRLVWERDGGICHMCGLKIPIEYYDCGHIIDRLCDGPDRESNLVVMCNVCNRYRKPLTPTREDYLQYLSKFEPVTLCYSDDLLCQLNGSLEITTWRLAS